MLFLSGVTGTRPDGSVSEDREKQFEQLFTHLAQYLRAAGARLDALVDIATCHVRLSEFLDAFTDAKDRHLHAPYPAWSAIGVSELITPGALLRELRAVAEDPHA